jgi:phage terminase small subunit
MRLFHLMHELPPEALGPKMLALRDDRRRRFAWLMACGEMNGAAAARTAGYSDVKLGAKVRASELMHDDDVLAAIEEASRKVLRGLAPLAIRAAREILEDSEHPQRARMIETLLDRTGHIAETRHTMTVEHSMDVKGLEELARRLAAETGVDAKRFLGTNAPVIEGTVVDERTPDA